MALRPHVGVVEGVNREEVLIVVVVVMVVVEGRGGE
jgi:hypothetical protein